MPRLIRLNLSDFRNYERLDWRLARRIAVIHGPNGSGKTNLLEAVSLLVPGRGLRGARTNEFVRRGAGGAWGVAGRFEDDGAALEIGTGSPPDGPSDRRVFRLDGATPRNQAEIAGRLAAVWLTPQMDRLFGEAASGRRRFLDRLVLALEPAHAREVAAHENAVSQRNRLLATGRSDPGWLAGVEDQIARHAVSMTAGRMELVGRLARTAPAGGFPAARIDLKCPIAAHLAGASALATEDWLRATLVAARTIDAASGGTSIGAHRADMSLVDVTSGTPAQSGSTGEQKAMLIGIILSHAALISERRGSAPLLLLDEPLVHLDSARRRALFASLTETGAQAILTGTDADVFTPLSCKADVFIAGDGALRAEN